MVWIMPDFILGCAMVIFDGDRYLGSSCHVMQFWGDHSTQLNALF